MNVVWLQSRSVHQVRLTFAPQHHVLQGNPSVSNPAKPEQEAVESDVVIGDLAHERNSCSSGAPQLRRFACVLPRRVVEDLLK